MLQISHPARSTLTPCALPGRLAAAALVGLALLCGAGIPSGAVAQARAARGPNAILSHVRLVLNKSRTLRIDYPVRDILVGSSEIADVIPLNEGTLYLLGKKVGTTNVSVFDADKRLIGLIDVEVGLDTNSLRARVKEGAGSSGIRVTTENDKLILSGVAADAPSVDRAVSVARDLAPGGIVNLTQVSSPQQVMLKVRFVEVSRSAGRDLGFRFEYAGRNAASSIGAVRTAASLNSSGSGTGTTGIPLLAAAGSVVQSATLGAVPFAQVLQRFSGTTQQMDLLISALESKGLARRLAEPNLVAMSGDSAEFHAGGEYPVPIASSSSGGFPTISIEYKEYGIKLRFTPTVLSHGLINLRLEPEVSELDASVAVNTGTVSVPGLTKRRARTTVELRDGQSFAIAGLLQTQSDRTVEQLPWLGSIPVIGALFRSTEFRSRETELVVIVTPQIVKPARPGMLLATPLDTSLPANDLDLFVSGKQEVKRNMREEVAANGALLGRHGHILPADYTASNGGN
jgi:pilus assembly protein CpaC